MASPRYFFRKGEILRGKKAFEFLFKHPLSIRKGVLKFFFVSDFPPTFTAAKVSFAFVVPKRFFKRAVDRNLLKRRMREAVRLHKHVFDALPMHQRLAIFIKYDTAKIATYHEMVEMITYAFARILRELPPPVINTDIEKN